MISDIIEGTKLFLDNKRVHIQNTMLNNIPIGSHLLVLEKYGYTGERLDINIKHEETKHITGELEKGSFQIPYRKIEVDGISDDWNEIEAIYHYKFKEDPFPDDTGTYFKNFKVAYDSKNLYYILEFNDTPCSAHKDYYYQINIYKDLGSRRNITMSNGNIRVNHNINIQPGRTFIWQNGNFQDTQDTVLKGANYLEGSIPFSIINFNTNEFYISCLLNTIPRDIWKADYVKVSIP